MKNVHYNKGFSLSELLVVMAIMSLLVGIGVPAVKTVLDSISSSASLRNMISAALNNARAMAIKEGEYAGIRFQTDANGDQYMVFIVHDDASSPSSTALMTDPERTGTNLANGFRALKGRKPVKLPGDSRVMDLKLRTNIDAQYPNYIGIDDDPQIDEDFEVYDTSTFCIIFSSAGKLVTHEVRVRNRHGKMNGGTYLSTDKLFNIDAVVNDGLAKFYQDDYPLLGLGQEYSRKSFIIYDKKAFDTVNPTLRWNNYLKTLEEIYINPYSGALVGG